MWSLVAKGLSSLVTLQWGFLHIVLPSVLSLNNLKIHKTKPVKNNCIQEIFILLYITTKSMRALWLVNQLWFIVPINPRKHREFSELLYKCGLFLNYITTKSMRALWLVNQLWVIVPVNPRKHCASSELLYTRNRPQVSMGYGLKTTWDVGKTLEEFVNHSPAARDVRILNSHVLPTSSVFYQPITDWDLWSIA